MKDSAQDTHGRLKSWVADYLAWMGENRYAASTIHIHERLLGHFQKFVAEKNLDPQNLFTYETLQCFEAHAKLLHASWSLRSLARYLAKKGAIPSAIRKPPPGLPAIYEEYLRFFEETGHVLPSTLEVCRRIMSALHADLAKRGIELAGLRIEHIDAFLDRYNAGLASATRRYNRSYLRGFLRYLYHNRNILKTDLATHVVGAVNFAHTNPPKFLRSDEIRALFAVPKTHTPWELRCLAMMHLLYALGLRPKEISRLTLDDLFFEKEEICIPNRKSFNPIMLPLPEPAIKAIAGYLVGARPNTARRELFLSLSGPIRPVAAATVSRDVTRFIRKIHPDATSYWLRHTYAQHLLESHSSIFEVKEMMGHDSLQSTRKYLHIHTALMRKVLFDESL